MPNGLLQRFATEVMPKMGGDVRPMAMSLTSHVVSRVHAPDASCWKRARLRQDWSSDGAT